MIRIQVLSRTLLLVRELVEANDLEDADIAQRFGQVRVLMVADDRNLACANGQTALITAFNLVARLGVKVTVDIPSVPLCTPQPPLEGHDLGDALERFSMGVIPGSFSRHLDGSQVDVALIVGDTPWDGQAKIAWRLSGSPWSGAISPVSNSVPCWTGDFPIGALTSAALAAPEVFKYVLRNIGLPPLPGRRDFIDPVDSAVHFIEKDVPDVFVPQRVNLDCISAGAITNAVLYTLFRVPGLQAHARVMDADRFDVSNLNRYMLALGHHIGLRKVDTLQEHSPLGWEVFPIPLDYSPNTSTDVTPLADNVVVGTDQIEPRWWVQSQWPKWLAVGSTSHFDIVVSEHTPGTPCAGCLHHTSDAGNGLIPTISFVSFWSGLLVAARLIRHLMGIPVDPHQQQTYLCPLQLNGRYARIDAAVAPHSGCPVERPSRMDWTA